MKKLHLLKMVFLLCALVVASMNGWADTATITFANQTLGTGDSGTELTTSTFVTNGIASSAAAFGTITCSATAKCYKGKVDSGLKAGGSSAAGSFTIAFSTALTNVTQITLNRASYNDSKTATITVKNGSTTLANAVSTPSGNADFADMNITGLSISALAGLTVETSKYCYIKSITITYTPSATPTCVAPTFSLAEGTYYEAKSVEINCATDGATIHYTTDGTTPTNSSTTYSTAIPVNETTTIKAIAVKTDYNNSVVASATYTIKSPVSGYNIDFEEGLVAYTDWTFTNADRRTTTITAHSGSYYGTTGGKATASITTKEKVALPGFFTCYISKESTNTTDSNWKIETSTNGTSWTEVGIISATGMSKGEWQEFSADLSAYSNVYVRLSYGSNTAVRAVDDITLTLRPADPSGDPDVAVTLTTTANMAGWRTYNNNTTNKYTVDGTTKVYYASATGENKVTLEEITGGVPANTVVILHQTNGTNTMILTKDDDATAVTPGSNLLLVSTVGQNLGKVFRLGYKSTHGVGFYTYTTTSAPAGIIYVSSIPAGAREFLGFDFGDDTTGVNEVKSQKLDALGEYFNLAGQRVAQPTKGLYIVNGKKIVIK